MKTFEEVKRLRECIEAFNRTLDLLYEVDESIAEGMSYSMAYTDLIDLTYKVCKEHGKDLDTRDYDVVWDTFIKIEQTLKERKG